MAKIGIQAKFNTLLEQRKSAELELIIEKFGRAMRYANREYIAGRYLSDVEEPRFTMSMAMAWAEYVEFCLENPE